MQHPAPALRTLSKLQSDFVPLFVEHGDPYKAAIAAGFAENTARAAATEILSRPNVALAIARTARLRLARGIPLALNVLELLVEKAQSEKVRLDAAKAILDRAGLVPPKSQDDRSALETPLHEMSMEELRAKAHELENEIVGRAKVIDAPDDSVVDLVG